MKKSILLFISVYPMLPIMYIALRSLLKVHNNIILGVTIPYNHIENMKVKENMNLYKKDLKKAFFFLSPIPIIPIFIKYYSIGITLDIIWIILAVAIMMLIYIKYNRILHKMKKENEWNNSYDVLLGDEYANEIQDKDVIKKKLDDDENWIYGMIYYNKNDKHIMVSSRSGHGNYAFNMASPVGKVIALILVVIILSLPAVCVMAIREEFTPITISFSDESFNVHHIGTKYEIDAYDIKSIKLIESLPEHSKNSGTNMVNLEKGSFEVKGYGKCTLCLNPVNNKFIFIETVDKKYIFSGKDDDETEADFEEILPEIVDKK
ncbi:PH domain-containing protein [Clostridium sp. BJN0001]|uniref:PH domain-containing protein n=1 Tax=Clostridium sp. BJN0001 TaxID=2930219 RepID=UPI001FD15054|nr:PH domain-containing protein [Clostridium sp. BJN0001]